MIKFFFVSVLLLASCSRHKDTLSFNLASESVQLDWHKANDNSSTLVLDNIMEGLTTYSGALQANQQGELLHPVPALASSWAISQEGKSYRFHIREGVRWSDGVALTAGQFVDSWQRLLNPETKSSSAYHLFDIVGAQDYASGTLKDFSRVGVKALNDTTLEVELRRPASYFLHLLATPGTFPLRKDLVEKFGAAWSSPLNLVTLGAYQVDAGNHPDRILLTANRQYWGGAPSIASVSCRMVTEPVTALALYANHELDILPRELPVSYYDYWTGSDDYRTGAKLQVSFLAFNVHKPPFDSVKNRRAFARSINREMLAKFFKGAQTATSSLIPPGMFGHMPSIGLSFDPPKGNHWGNVRLRYNASDNLNLAFQSLQAFLRQQGGEQIRLEPMEWKDYKEFISSFGSKHRVNTAEQPNALYVNWVADYPDPHAFMNIFTSASESNFSGWNNKHYDALVEAAVETEDESQRMSLYEQAQRILLEEDVVILPLFFSSHQALVRANINGVVLNSLDKWYFKDMRFER